MKIVVDTNIVFSGLISPKGTISDLLMNSSDVFNFYSPTSVLDELDAHHQKLLKLSGITKDELNFLKRVLLRKIDLIDLEAIQQTMWEKATELTENVDAFDTPFIALSLALNAPLWTGDKKLTKGLSQKGIDWILNTKIVKKIRDEK